MTKLLSRDAILSASDIKTEDVAVPEWGGTVRVKGMTAAERDIFETKAVRRRGKDIDLNLVGIRATVAAMTIVDAKGEPIFTEKDVKALGEKSGAALSRVFGVATKLSGLGDDDIEELSKNSEADQSEDSPSG